MLSSRMKQWLLLVILILVTFFLSLPLSLSLCVSFRYRRLKICFFVRSFFFFFDFIFVELRFIVSRFPFFLSFDSRVWLFFGFLVPSITRLLYYTIYHCYHVLLSSKAQSLVLVFFGSMRLLLFYFVWFCLVWFCFALLCFLLMVFSFCSQTLVK